MDSKAYFEQVANQWEQMRQSFFSENVRETAYATAEVQPGQTAVDVGAGTGFITEGLLQKGLSVIAIDPSEAMLAEMKKRFVNSDRVDYRKGDAQNLPVPDHAADFVFANMCLHHVESPGDAIQEMTRVLKPGGRLVITDLDEHNFDFLREEHHDRWMGFKRENVRSWLAEAGLQEVRVDCVGEDCCAQSSCGGESASISIFIAHGRR